MKYIGMDIHKDYCIPTVMDENGDIERQERIETKDESLGEFLAGIGDEAKLVIESTGLWEHVYEVIEEAGYYIPFCTPKRFYLQCVY